MTTRNGFIMSTTDLYYLYLYMHIICNICTAYFKTTIKTVNFMKWFGDMNKYFYITAIAYLSFTYFISIAYHLNKLTFFNFFIMFNLMGQTKVMLTCLIMV